MPQEVFKTDYVEITYHPDIKTIKIVWTDNSTSDQYREVIQKTLDYADTHVIENYLSDIRKQKVVSPEDRKWFEKEIIPKAIEKGLKRAFVIFDGNVFKKYYLNAILKTTNIMKLPLKIVSSEEEALKWINSQK